MNQCPVCREKFTPGNPESNTVMFTDQEGEAFWLPVCRECAEDLATQHQ